MKIAIIGSGVVGSATGLGFVNKGNEVIFIDTNPAVISKLRGKGLKAYDNYEILEKEDAEIIFLSVCTPTVNEKINLDYLISAIHSVGNILRLKENYPVVTVRSTVPPGTTENIFIPILEEVSLKKADEDFGVCMNPEFLREETAEKDFCNAQLIVIGSRDKKSRNILDEIYRDFECPIYHMSIKEAEMEKYTHNLLNAAKISFFNEMRHVCEKLDINADRVFKIVSMSAESCWNPLYGTRNLGPYGGSCLPKDTKAFYSFAIEELKMTMVNLKAIMRVNELTEERMKFKKMLEQVSFDEEKFESFKSNEISNETSEELKKTIVQKIAELDTFEFQDWYWL